MTKQIRVNGNQAELRILQNGQVVEEVRNDKEFPIKGLRFENNCAIFETKVGETKTKFSHWITIPYKE